MGCGKPCFVELHLLDRQRARVLHPLDRRQPLDEHAFLQRLLDLEIVRRHLLARAAVDDDRLGGAQPLGGACNVERRVAAAVDDDAAAQHRLVLALHAAQHRHGVEHPRGLASRDVCALGDVRADREKGRVEASLAHGVEDVPHLVVELQFDPELDDALDLGVQHVARQSVFRDAEAHHAARQRARFSDGHAMPAAAQMIRGREPRRAGADDQNALARFLARPRELPAPLDRFVAQEALDGVDADRLVELPAVARTLAGVIADAPHDGGKRVVLDERAPCGLVVAALGMVEPGLDVLAGGARVVARRQAVDVDRPRGPPRARLVGERGADVERDRERLVHQAASLVSSRPNFAMLRSAIAWICATRAVSGCGVNRCAKRFCSCRYSVTGTGRRIGVRPVISP